MVSAKIRFRWLLFLYHTKKPRQQLGRGFKMGGVFLENIKDLLDKLEDEEINNPFASVPNQKLRDALNFLEETAAEITPRREQE